jgi:2-polyprenyl-3-methyl-5-hydroxy-6-metoxy-1,4-benzoquinol methylase
MLIDTVDVACANCGSTAADEIASATDVEFGTCDNVCRFARCRQCGVTYLRNRPTEAALPVIYPESYYRYAEFLGPVTHFLRSLVQRQRVALLRKLVAGPATVMEVGCGEGQLIRAIRERVPRSWRVVGVDINETACRALAAFGIEMHCSLVEHLDWPVHTVDVLILNQVIEHVASPRQVVRRAAELLRPGGLLWIETPSTGAWDQRIAGADEWGGWHCPRHWVLYDKPSLAALFESEGFSVVRSEYLLSPFIWAHTVQNMLRARTRAGRWAQDLMSERSVPALCLYSAIDMVQRVVSGRTSNMRMIGALRAARPSPDDSSSASSHPLLQP